jgi:hypothetical protein
MKNRQSFFQNRPNTVKIEWLGPSTGSWEIWLPSKFVVCPRCEGEGKHVNPNVDGNGISAEEFAEDPDFAESYFSGVYDVRCEECHGERVVSAVDVDKLTRFEKLIYEDWARAEASYRAELAYERRLRERGIEF